jgi:hypothetical protein
MLISLRTLHDKYLPDLSRGFIADMAKRGDIPAIKLFGRWMFDPEAVLASLKARERGGVKGPAEPARLVEPNRAPNAASSTSDAKE